MATVCLANSVGYSFIHIHLIKKLAYCNFNSKIIAIMTTKKLIRLMLTQNVMNVSSIRIF